MKSVILRRLALGIALAGVVSTAATYAEDGTKALPTLLIKGEVVSLDTSDPSAELLTVKDRYGFETPILLTQETKISQGAASANATKLAAGTAVEVEYNFDVNTAKRHAVSVKLPPAAAVEATLPAPVSSPKEVVPPVVGGSPVVAPTPTPPPAPMIPSASMSTSSAAPAPTESTSAPSAPSAPSTPKAKAAPATTQ